jgi:MFS family permease
MSWGLFPIVYAGAGLDLHSIGVLAAIYPAVWGIGQLATGALSDRIGRKWLIASGMWIQAGSIAMVAMVRDFPSYAVCAVLLGVGTAMVYPTLLAAVGDVAHPSSRASAIGRYRLWRDLGYAAGALLAGATADVVGIGAAIVLVAVMTFGSGAIVAARLHERRGGEEDFRTVDERVGAEAS